MKRGIMIACLIGLMAAIGAQAEETNAPPPRPPGGNRPMSGNRPNMENLLPSRILEDLSLTAEQKTKYDALAADFKKDAAKWRADNQYDPEKAFEEMRKAREANDDAAIKKLNDQRKGLMDLRKSYTDKVRAFLTDEQKTKLDKALEGFGRGPRGGRGPNGPGGPPPPPAPPTPTE